MCRRQNYPQAGALKSVKERGAESQSHCSAGARFARRTCRGREHGAEAARRGAARRGVARRLPTRAFERAFSLTFLNATPRDRGRRSVPRRVPRSSSNRPSLRRSPRRRSLLHFSDAARGIVFHFFSYFLFLNFISFFNFN